MVICEQSDHLTYLCFTFVVMCRRRGDRNRGQRAAAVHVLVGKHDRKHAGVGREAKGKATGEGGTNEPTSCYRLQL